jgi:CheY-like chemotaxis protein
MISRRRSRKRIFLVDDEPDITMTISMVLESKGFEVQSYNDPMLALSSFRPHYYDLIILDVKMPSTDGFELYNEIRRIDDKVKVCFITATDKTDYESLENSEQAAEDYKEISQHYCALKKDMFLQKPISNDDLINEINNRLNVDENQK